jgi:hypothetical protein
VVEALKPRFEESLAKVSKGGKVAEATRYGLNNWDNLPRFLDDGRIEIDSNTIERSIRGVPVVPCVANAGNAADRGTAPRDHPTGLDSIATSRPELNLECSQSDGRC